MHFWRPQQIKALSVEAHDGGARTLFLRHPSFFNPSFSKSDLTPKPLTRIVGLRYRTTAETPSHFFTASSHQRQIATFLATPINIFTEVLRVGKLQNHSQIGRTLEARPFPRTSAWGRCIGDTVGRILRWPEEMANMRFSLGMGHAFRCRGIEECKKLTCGDQGSYLFWVTTTF